jgi:tRNA dimethylallyltransferase
MDERDGIEHYGIDILYPNESFDVTLFMKLYQDIYHKAQEREKNLVIVGGTGFYLKSMIDGISPLPKLSISGQERVADEMRDMESAYKRLAELDPTTMNMIKSNDKYRIEKALAIYVATDTIPSLYFQKHPPIPTIIGKLPIYSIDTPREILRQRITKRTEEMLCIGLIDEVTELEYRYSRTPNAMKAIGIIETLSYLDGYLNRVELIEKITTNTARLAKRQNTFNKSQFGDTISLGLEELRMKILGDICRV